MREPPIREDGRRALIVEMGVGPDDGRVEAVRTAFAGRAEGLGETAVFWASPESEGSRAREIASSFGQVHGFLDSRDPVALTRLLSSLRADGIRMAAFLPSSSSFNAPDWQGIPAHEPAVKIWLPRLEPPSSTAREYELAEVGWIASMPLIELMMKHGIRFSFNASAVVDSVLMSPIEPLWISSRSAAAPAAHAANDPILNRDSKVLAIVPHYRCERWLARCLHSLTTQTRPPDSIAVLDDASETPPRDIAAGYPGVTLLRARENVGPYNLAQTVIDSTDYDAYLFQDADDWSTRDRIDLLLEAAEQTGAELIGTQELRFYTETGAFHPVCYPIDVNRALSERSGHPLLHPTSLAARPLIRRIGGLATGLRFGGDTEFLRRAGYAGRIVNVPQYCYVRRVRPLSLTTDPTTGFGSPARQHLRVELDRRAAANRTRVARGQAPVLSPYRVAPPTVFDHILGPALVRERAGGSHASLAP